MATKLTFLKKAMIGWFADGEHADGSRQTPPVPEEGVLNRPIWQLYQNLELLFQAVGGLTDIFQTNGGDNGLTMMVGGAYQHTATGAVTFKLPTDQDDPNSENPANRVPLVSGNTVRVTHIANDIVAFPVTISGNGNLIGTFPEVTYTSAYVDVKFIWNGTSWDAIRMNSGDTGVGAGLLSPVRAVIDINVTTSGLGTRDGVVLATGDRVLCIGMTDKTKNGPWIVRAGAWVRPSDFSVGTKVAPSCLVTVSEGSLWADSVFQLTSDGTITIGTSLLNFAPANQKWVRRTAQSISLINVLTFS